jgi:hypothetical protein
MSSSKYFSQAWVPKLMAVIMPCVTGSKTRFQKKLSGPSPRAISGGGAGRCGASAVASVSESMTPMRAMPSAMQWWMRTTSAEPPS